MKITKTQSVIDGRTILTFRLKDHPENPVIDISTDSYPSGDAIRKAVLLWAEEYGGGEF